MPEVTQQPAGNTEAALLAGGALVDPKAISMPSDPSACIPFVVVPAGYKLQDLEKIFQTPSRKRGTVTVFDAKGFISVVNSHKGAETSVYGVLGPTPAFTAVFNGNHADGPGWGDHIAQYSCPLSDEWNIWSGANKKHASQAEFAQFIEDNARDIIEPAMADMVEVSRSLEAKKNVNFKSGLRLDNGTVDLKFEETVEARAGQGGNLSVPESFTIAIPVFKNGVKWSVQCRLRYRIGDGGRLVMWYDMVQSHKVIDEASKEVWKEIETAVGVEIIHGRQG